MKKKNNFKISFISVILTLVAIFIIYELLDINSIKTVDDSTIYTQEEVNELVLEAKEEGRRDVLSTIKEALMSGRSVLSVLKQLYPEKLVIASSGVYHWVDIIDELPKNNYNIDNLSVDEDTLAYKYMVDGELKSKRGIDVSSHQGKIDWEKVADDGIEFTFVRALYRGYGSGAIVIDENCISNVNGAKEAGLDVGVYVFSQAINKTEAVEEADEVIKLLNGMELSLPIVYDVEKFSGTDARMNALSIDERTDVTIAFLERVKSAGYEVMLYHNTEMGALMIDLTRLQSYDKWFAGYNREFYWPYEFKIWQYSESGSVDGIDGDVDLDLMFID